MRLGLMADTHDNVERTRTALSLLEERDVEALLHMGDLASPRMLELFDGWSVRLCRGNVDHEHAILEAVADLDHLAYAVKHELAASGRRIGIIHGDDKARLESMIASGAFDLVCHGHSHRFRDERIGGTRVVNPGAVHRAATPSVCIYDPSDDDLERIEI